jgi:hypothetical protein
MPETQPDVYALLELSFQSSPNLRSHKSFPHRSNELRSVFPATEPLFQDHAQADDDTRSQASTQDCTPLASPAVLTGADTGLPPTPPSNSHDDTPSPSFSQPPYADGVVSSLMAKKSSLSTPVNQRSPPTPDASPPRANEYKTFLERPALIPYPSSRAESFTTAREDQASTTDESESRSNTPLADRTNAERGLGLAFEREKSDTTPTNRVQHTYPPAKDAAIPHKDPSAVRIIPDREWDTNLMRNVTVRRQRNAKLSPQKNTDAAKDAGTRALSLGSPRPSSGRRDRGEVGGNSPRTASIESFARSIGWPTETISTPREQPRNEDSNRLSTSSMTSTIVEAVVFVTPPQRQRTLRHSGKNLALRSDGGSPTPRANRHSLNMEDMPLHRLVHQKPSVKGRSQRIRSESATSNMDRTASPVQIQKRLQDNAAYTLAHQESVRSILQPAAEIMSRSNSTRSYISDRGYHMRIASTPDTTRAMRAYAEPRTFLELSPPESPTPAAYSTTASQAKRVSQSPKPHIRSPRTRERRRNSLDVRDTLNINKSLPELPIQSTDELAHEAIEPDVLTHKEARIPNSSHSRRKVPRHAVEALDMEPPTPYHDAVSEQPRERAAQPQSPEIQEYRPHNPRAPSSDSVTTAFRRGSLSIRGRSEERRRNSSSRDRSSTSRDAIPRPSMDRTPTDELSRRSQEGRSPNSDEYGRVSFDQSTPRSDEHAMARHLFAQTTPFSQFSDTPIEVSEATTVSIYPHNNHSLLVVQQVARSSTFPTEQKEMSDDRHLAPPSSHATGEGSALLLEINGEQHALSHPTVTFQPSTPPMQISLPVPGGVDSPLKNPRTAPEPPVFKVIPPTPADELERQLALAPPGPPKRSDSHPQRRLSLVQRARRYSDNLISPFLARASSARGRHYSESHAHGKPQVPSVNDEDGTLHPFWRPRGFWDGFDDSDSESDDEAILPEGGDTSDVPEPEPELEPSSGKFGVLGRRLTSSFKAPTGFLIGNSLGVERHGTNKRRPHVSLPSQPSLRRKQSAPRIMIQAPTLPFMSRSQRVEKRGSRASMRTSSSSWERPRRRDTWRRGKRIPGVGLQVQYIGLSGVKERFLERRKEKRRDQIRKSIGTRYYVEPGTTSL